MRAEPKKLDDPDVLRAALVLSGTDPERMVALSGSQAVTGELLANTSRSVAHGTFGSPTFSVGDEIFFRKDKQRNVAAAVIADAGG